MKPVAAMTAALAAVLLVAVPAAGLQISLKVLIMTTPGFTNTDFLQSVMNGLGVPYDVAPTPLGNVTQLLWNADGSAKYAGFVMYPNIEAMGYLNQSDVNTIWDYQQRTGVRSLKFGAWPTNVGFNPDTANCASTDQAMTFTAATPYGISGIKPTAQLSNSGLYRCPAIAAQPLNSCNMWAADFAATGIISACTSAPITLYSSNTYVGTTLVKYADGREVLATMHECAGWSLPCLVLGHLSVSWMLQSILPGERMATLSVEMDDLFLFTDFDPVVPVPGNLNGYRLTVPDAQALLTWQDAVTAKLPAGSDFKVDFPFNGNGILEVVTNALPNAQSVWLEVEDRGCLDLPDYKLLNCTCWLLGYGSPNCPATEPIYCRNCTKNWPKPLGSGTSRVPGTAPASQSTWSRSEILAADPLATMVINNQNSVVDRLHWCHHTFTHENLDNATLYDAQEQIKLNIAMAGPGFLNLTGRPTFSSKCMVTPEISGLFNGDTLAALTASGVTCATGDNTWTYLVNQQNPYHMLYSTAPLNGFNGFAILPRSATEIYYNCSTPDQNMELYNKLYTSYYGTASTVDQLVAREATRVVRDNLLKLRHDPMMMHQANNAQLDGTGLSLLMRWVNAVTDLYLQFVNWPVRSLKIDDLYALYQAREARDACQLSYALQVNNGTVTSVTATSGASGSGTCSAPLLLGAGDATANPQSINIPVAKGASATVQLSGQTWGVN